MRYILSAAMAIIFSASAIAQEVNVVISGKQGGSSYTRSVTLGKFLENKGYQVNLIKSFSGKKGYKWFTETDQPAVIAFTDSNYALVEEAPLKEGDVAVIEFESYLYVCGNTAKDSVNFSWRSDYPKGLSSFLEEFYSTKFVNIPYDSSSAEIEGLLAGDIDAGMFNVKNAGKLIAKGVQCAHYTGPTTDTERGAEPLRATTENPMSSLSFTYFVMSKGIDLQKELSELVADEDYALFLKGRRGSPFDASGMSAADIADYLNQQANNWR